MRLGGESNRSLGKIARKSWEDFLALRRNGLGGPGVEESVEGAAVFGAGG